MSTHFRTVTILLVLLVIAVGCSERPPALTITTTPPGASVFVDWKYVGTTPVKELPLEPGIHAVRIEKHSHTRWSQLVAVRSGVEKLHVDLLATQRGRIEITSVPPGAEVCLNGEAQRGKTPLTLTDLPHGTHELMVLADDHDPWLGKVELTSDAATVKAVLHSHVVEYYEKEIEKEPNNIFSYTELAHHYIIRGDFDRAVDCLARALKISSRSPHHVDRDAVNRLYQELAKIHVGWFEYASPAEVAKLQPKIQEIVHRYGNNNTFRKQVMSWGRQKDPNRRRRFDPRRANAEAIANLQKILKQKPNDVELIVRIAELQLGNFNLEEARQSLDKALKIDPHNYRAHIQLSAIHRRMGKHEQAEKALENATKLCKDPVEKGNLHEKLAGVYQTRLTDADAVAKWHPKAVAQWEQAIRLAEDPERACQRRFRLALLYRRVGEKDKALELFKQIVEISKNEGLRNYAKYFLKHASKK